MADVIGFVCYLFKENPYDFIVALSIFGMCVAMFFDSVFFDFSLISWRRND